MRSITTGGNHRGKDTGDNSEQTQYVYRDEKRRESTKRDCKHRWKQSGRNSQSLRKSRRKKQLRTELTPRGTFHKMQIISINIQTAIHIL